LNSFKKLAASPGLNPGPFILGLLKEGHTEKTFENINHKIKQQINRNLSWVKKKLNLSIPLNLSMARDRYASTLIINGSLK
jgi:hypothetical protein